MSKDSSRLDSAKAVAAIRDAMKERGLTQADVSAMSGLSRQTISNMMTGAHAPSVKTIDRLFDALDLDPADYEDHQVGAWIGLLEGMLRQMPAESLNRIASAAVNAVVAEIRAMDPAAGTGGFIDGVTKSVGGAAEDLRKEDVGLAARRTSKDRGEDIGDT